jgi:membrane protein required for colicin V production
VVNWKGRQRAQLHPSLERPMNAFDILVAVFLSYGLIRGLFRGLVKELASIIGALGGFFTAYSLYGAAAGYLSGLVSNHAYRNILAFMAIFCGVVILVSLLALVIQYVLRIAFLGWLDRLGGAVFGILKGVLTVSVLFLVLTAFLPKGTPLIRDSMSGPYVSMVSEQLAALVSKEIKTEFSAKLDALKKAWNPLK